MAAEAQQAATHDANVALVARQPIFDAGLAVVAYELLYRTPGARRAQVADPASATAQVMISAALDIGLTQLLGPHAAYINFPPGLITRFEVPLHPERVVIELLEGSAPAADLLLALRRLRERGYRIALDDYDMRRESPLLLEHADIVKLDIREHSRAELAASVAALRRHPLQLVAEKIETAQELALCRELGFDLFQGYLLQAPQTVQAQRIPGERRSALELVVRLNEATASIDDIEQVICRDVGLSCRILRCINSSYFGMAREVSSIREAIMLLGFGELQKLCWLMLLAGLTNQPAYLCIQSLQRARMCESLCQQARLANSDAYFMIGMLSMLDVFVGQPMPQAVAALPLHASVREGLLRRSGELGAALRCAECYEQGKWEGAQFGGLDAGEIAACYLRATAWADAAWSNFRSAI